MHTNSLQKAILRVPEVTIVFWIIKTLSTTVGETGADFLASNLGFGMPMVAIIASGLMAALLVIQFTKLKRYVPFNYWSIVLLMSIVGTLITDILVDTAGVSLVTLSIVFSIAMIFGFFIWYKQEGTLSIHSVDTTKRESYYWLIILIAFALGTGAGDLISERLAQGYGVAVLAFGGLIALVAIAYYAFKISSVLAFWLVFILTRPLGASLGDFLTKPATEGGLDVSMVVVNGLFISIILGLVIHLTLKQEKAKETTI